MPTSNERKMLSSNETLKELTARHAEKTTRQKNYVYIFNGD